MIAVLPTDHVVQLPVSALTFAVGSVVPLLTALIVHARATPTTKAVANLLLAAVAGALTAAVQASGRVVPLTLLYGILTSFAGSVTSYRGLFAPTGWADKVATAVPGGIGAPAAPAKHAAPEQQPAPEPPDDVAWLRENPVPESFGVPQREPAIVGQQPAPPLGSQPAQGSTLGPPRPGPQGAYSGLPEGVVLPGRRVG